MGGTTRGKLFLYPLIVFLLDRLTNDNTIVKHEEAIIYKLEMNGAEEIPTEMLSTACYPNRPTA